MATTTLAAAICICTLGAPPEITPRTMAELGFAFTCEFTDQMITVGDQPERPTGVVTIRIIVDAKQGPAIQNIDYATLNIQRGKTLILSVDLHPHHLKESSLLVPNCSVHAKLIPHVEFLLHRKDHGGYAGAYYRLKVNEFFKASRAEKP